MKTIVSAAALLLAAGLAFSPISRADEKARRGAEKQSTPSIHSANRFIGLEVLDRQGEQIGEIRDVLLDLDNGRIAYAVISSGGVFGIGDSNYIVPWKAIKTEQEEMRVTLNMSKEQLSEAPKRNADMSDQQYHRELHRFYGVSPNWEDRSAESAPGDPGKAGESKDK